MVDETQPAWPGSRRMRDVVLGAARELTVARGWAKVTMADVAEAAGVSRRTVYNEFSSRDELARAVVQREVDGFLAGLAELLAADDGDLRSGVERAVSFALLTAADNPLVKAVITNSGDDSLLPYLTTDAGVVLQGATELIASYARRYAPDASPDRLAVGAELMARVVVSNILWPGAPAEEVASDLAELATRFMQRHTDCNLHSEN